MTTNDWITSGHTGISSKCIWAHFMGTQPPRWASHPLDPSDFLRCYWLLKLAPEWRQRIAEMGKYRGWKKLAAHWDELEKILEMAWPKCCSFGDYCDEPPARAMYDRMRELQ